MARDENTSAIIDGLLRFLVVGGSISVALMAPGMAKAIDKPLTSYLDKLDARSREREVQRLVAYMKRTGLIKGDYAHGLIITSKGRKRAEKADFDELQIARPVSWDGKWRLVLFDIPEEFKSARNALSSKLKSLGFILLQRSVWIHPYPCREELETVTLNYEVSKFVTYIETSHIDHQDKLVKKFAHILK